MPKPVTTDYVRLVYSRAPVDSLKGGRPNPTPEYAAEQFDAWLEAVKVAAFNEGYSAGESGACPPLEHEPSDAGAS